jgi:hypothetical protein
MTMSDTKADAPGDGHESEARQRSIYATAGAFEGLSAPGTPVDDMPVHDTVDAIAGAMHREAVAVYGVLRAIPTDLAAWWLRDALAGRCKIDNGYSPALNDRIRALVAAGPRPALPPYVSTAPGTRGLWSGKSNEQYWNCPSDGGGCGGEGGFGRAGTWTRLPGLGSCMWAVICSSPASSKRN